jgi:hypothetical protein
VFAGNALKVYPRLKAQIEKQRGSAACGEAAA